MQKLKSFLVFSIFCFSLIFISCEQPNQNSGENQIDDEEEVSFEGFDILSSYQIDRYGNACVSSREDLIIEFDLEDIDTTDYSFEYENKNKYLTNDYITLEKAQNNPKKVIMTVEKEILVSLDADYNVGFGYIEKNAIDGKLIVQNTSTQIIKEIEIENVKVNSWPLNIDTIKYANLQSYIVFWTMNLSNINDIHYVSVYYRDGLNEDFFFTENYNFMEKDKIFLTSNQYTSLYLHDWPDSLFLSYNIYDVENSLVDGSISVTIRKSYNLEYTKDPFVTKIELIDDYGLVSDNSKIHTNKLKPIGSKFVDNIKNYEKPNIFLMDSKGNKYTLESDELIEFPDEKFYIATDLFNNNEVDYYNSEDVKNKKELSTEFIEYDINGFKGTIHRYDSFYDSFTDKQAFDINRIYNINAFITRDSVGLHNNNELELTKVKVAKPFYIKADANSSIADGSFEKPIKYFDEIENVIKAEDGGKYINNTVYLFKACGVFEEETLEFYRNSYEFYYKYDQYAPTCIYITANDSSTLVKELTVTAMNSSLFIKDINVEHINRSFHAGFTLEGEINTTVSYASTYNDNIYEFRGEDNQYYVAYNTEPVAEIGLKNYTGEIRIMVHKNAGSSFNYALFNFSEEVIIPSPSPYDDNPEGTDVYENERLIVIPIKYKNNPEKGFTVILDCSRNLNRYASCNSHYHWHIGENGQLIYYESGK